jgi:thiol-disulfide isomerase/thioredoxin
MRFIRVVLILLLLPTIFISCSSSIHLDRLNDAQIQALPTNSKVVLLHFWATWCEPCRKEIPELNQLHEKYPAVEFVAINLDDVENQGAIEPFLKKYPVNFRVVLRSGQDFQNMAQSLDPDWKGGVPATFVFQDGKRIFHKIGEVSVQELDETLQHLGAS